MCEAKIYRTEKRSRQVKIMVGDFNTPSSPSDDTAREKISKDIKFNSSTNQQVDLIYIFIHETPPNNNRIHTLYNVYFWNVYQDRPYPGPRTNLNKLKRIQVK